MRSCVAMVREVTRLATNQSKCRPQKGASDAAPASLFLHRNQPDAPPGRSFAVTRDVTDRLVCVIFRHEHRVRVPLAALLDPDLVEAVAALGGKMPVSVEPRIAVADRRDARKRRNVRVHRRPNDVGPARGSLETNPRSDVGPERHAGVGHVRPALLKRADALRVGNIRQHVDTVDAVRLALGQDRRHVLRPAAGSPVPGDAIPEELGVPVQDLAHLRSRLRFSQRHRSTSKLRTAAVTASNSTSLSVVKNGSRIRRSLTSSATGHSNGTALNLRPMGDRLSGR